VATPPLTRIAWLFGAGTIAIVLAALTFRAPRPESEVVVASAAAADAPSPEPVRAVLDRRALSAVTDLHRLVTGDSATADARLENDRWVVRCDERRIGSLPESHRYEDLRNLLVAYAVALGAREASHADAALAESELARLEAALRASSAGEVLARIDGLASGRRDPRVLRLASHAIVLLRLQCADQVDASDALAAHAMAVVALAASVDSGAVVRDECLLAETLHDEAFALRIASRLPERDPVRAFAMHEDSTLVKLAAKSREPQALYLTLVRLGENRDAEGWSRWSQRYFSDESSRSLPVLVTSLGLGRAETQMPILVRVMEELRAIDRAPSPPRTTAPTVAELTSEFEGLLARLPATGGGSLLDRDVVRSYYRSDFYSALASLTAAGSTGDASR